MLRMGEGVGGGARFLRRLFLTGASNAVGSFVKKEVIIPHKNFTPTTVTQESINSPPTQKSPDMKE